MFLSYGSFPILFALLSFVTILLYQTYMYQPTPDKFDAISCCCATIASRTKSNVAMGLTREDTSMVRILFSTFTQALKAGNDLLLVPRRIKEEVEAVLAAVKKGELTEKEIETKCRKVLKYKYALGLEKKPHVQLSGYGGQSYIAKMDDKIKELRAIINEKGLDIDIEVDGGISAKNVAHVKECGANVFVAGSAVFNGDIASSAKDILEVMEA